MARPLPRAAEIKKWLGEIPIKSVYTAGLGGQLFFKTLRDTGTLVGTRCVPCQQIYVPARRFCERCFGELTELRTVGPEGIIKSFSVCFMDYNGRRLKEPAAFALVQLKGATTVMLHKLLGVDDLSRVAIGGQVKASIKPKGKRTGSILDIEGFRLIGRPGHGGRRSGP